MLWIILWTVMFPAALAFGGVNNACAHVEDCDSSSTCVGGTCVCKPTYVYTSYLNKCLAGVGQSCVSHYDCIGGAFCTRRHICKCKAGPHAFLNVTSCQPFDLPCQTHSDCIHYGDRAQCLRGNCECDWGNEHFAADKCQETRELGRPCMNSHQCYVMSDSSRVECNAYNKTCTCKENYVTNMDENDCDSAMPVPVTSGILVLVSFALASFAHN